MRQCGGRGGSRASTTSSGSPTKTNDATRTLGVAFDGCTLPGADRPLFTVADGTMDSAWASTVNPVCPARRCRPPTELADLLVDGVLAEKPTDAADRVAVILNGLGRTKYEELFVVWKTVAAAGRAG